MATNSPRYSLNMLSNLKTSLFGVLIGTLYVGASAVAFIDPRIRGGSLLDDGNTGRISCPSRKGSDHS